MKDIALAIMVVGLCFNEAYCKKNNLKIDGLETFFAIIGAIILIT